GTYLPAAASVLAGPNEIAIVLQRVLPDSRDDSGQSLPVRSSRESAGRLAIERVVKGREGLAASPIVVHGDRRSSADLAPDGAKVRIYYSPEGETGLWPLVCPLDPLVLTANAARCAELGGELSSWQDTVDAIDRDIAAARVPELIARARELAE